jgi:hypothetical protein
MIPREGFGFHAFNPSTLYNSILLINKDLIPTKTKRPDMPEEIFLAKVIENKAYMLFSSCIIITLIQAIKLGKNIGNMSPEWGPACIFLDHFICPFHLSI